MNEILTNSYTPTNFIKVFPDEIISSDNTNVKIVNNIIDAEQIRKQNDSENTFSSETNYTFILEYPSTHLKESLEKNNELKNQLVQKLIPELYRDLQTYSLDSCEISLSEKKIISIEHNYSMDVLGEVLQNIYVNHFDEPFILAGICDCLCRFDLSEVKPWGSTMLAGLLAHKNEIVQEYATLLIENWTDTSLLPILENINCSSSWLKNYVSEVILYLRESK